MQTEIAKWDRYYPNLEVAVFAPKFYYSMEKKRDEYSKNIVLGKQSDLSAYFFEDIKETFSKLPIKPNLIVVIPSSKMESYSPTMIELGIKLSNTFGIENSNIVERIKQGKKLTKCSSCDERFHEVNDSFNVTQQLDGEKIVLLDDTRVTGMTILECAKELREAGASDIVAVCLGINEN